ncbi:MAG: agmatine deiminase family protein [Saccharospirillum sp.]
MTAIRLPAEWHKQDAILLTWPHQDSDWREQLADVESVYLDILGQLSHSQDILIQLHPSIDFDTLSKRFEREGINQARCHLIPLSSVDTWARDHGPVTVLRDDNPCLYDFTFNGWGAKFEAAQDNALNRAMAELGVFDAPMETLDWVLEGGSIESDGAGTLMTTRQCLLNANRNGPIDEAEMTDRLTQWFGVERVIWLTTTALAGDDTDAHIDTLARFAPGQRIVYQGCDDPQDPHHGPLSAMTDELASARSARGEPFELIALPWPDAQFSDKGERLPATYANFLICNHIVLAPCYGVRQDELALSALSRAFPEHRVVGINCRALIEQHGSLHCITMQLPEGTVNRHWLDRDES